MDQFDVAVVGSGPAGCSTAIHLAKTNPELAARTVVIEATHHPRPKLCGGGLTDLSQYFIASMGLVLDVPFEPVHELAFRFRGREVRVQRPFSLLVVRREQFDAALAGEVRKLGVELREGTALTRLEVPRSEGDLITLHTTAGAIQAKAVVGADGTRSMVRRQIGLEGASHTTRAIEVLTPEDENTCEGFARSLAVFDFSYLPDGLQGYMWDFPSRVDGRPRMNRGACDFRVHTRRPLAPMKEQFRSYLQQQSIDLDSQELMGSPSRWYDPTARLSAPGVILAGDAAGIESWGGDGISASLWYGQVVAGEIERAARLGDWSFSGYEQRLASSELGRHLTRRLRQARLFYRLRSTGAILALGSAVGWQMRRRARREPSVYATIAGGQR